MIKRPRILRKSPSIRAMVAETRLSPADFIAPLFVTEGKNVKEEIPALPGYFRKSLDETLKDIQTLSKLGIQAVLLFAKCPNALKDKRGTEALNPDGLMQRSIKAIKDAVPHITVMTDVALDPYNSDGHDGLVENGKIRNDASVEVLCKMAVSHAGCGADFVAPSDMMDGRVRKIRAALEMHNYTETGILSYSAKYCSALYGPFRDALDSAPGFGDKKTYQMNPANRIEAIKEAEMDIEEGADIIMVKPAISYLDIIREVKNRCLAPVAAYHVSGEYAMIKMGATYGGMDEAQLILEHTTAIKRAGADIIATYFARDVVKLIA